MKSWLSVAAGAVLLIWPAFANGYPLVFSDTAGLLEQALLPDMGWDKPWVYGPFLLMLHGRTTLWIPTVAQGLLLSHLIWLAQKTVTRPGALWHVALCAVLAAGSAAPWFAALMMPDIFAPLTVLCMFALGFGRRRLSRIELGWVVAVGALAIAVHLAHLIVAAACVAAIWALRGRLLWRPVAPLGIALAALLVSNAVGNGVVGISPYGSLFMLARLVGDGPARRYIDEACPEADVWLCAWKGRLAHDSDDFLWDPDGPIWANNSGPIQHAPEAARIVRATVLAYPLDVLEAAARNTWRQLGMVQVWDTLYPIYLNVTVWPTLQKFFPPEEQARYAASMEPNGTLPAFAARFAVPYTALLVLGALGSLALLPGLWRGTNLARGCGRLSALVLVGLLANAFATGALSHPHDRYQARIAWLVLLPPGVFLLYRREDAGQAARTADSSGGSCTSAS